MAGKSVVYHTRVPAYEGIPFVVGGSGMLLSHALVQELAPLIPTCRKKYNQLKFGDARVGACIQLELNLSKEIQPMAMADLFTNGDPMTTITHHGQNAQMQNDRLISLHEKDMARIELLQNWIVHQRAKNKTITWKTMWQSGLHIGLNKAGMHQT